MPLSLLSAGSFLATRKQQQVRYTPASQWLLVSLGACTKCVENMWAKYLEFVNMRYILFGNYYTEAFCIHKLPQLSCAFDCYRDRVWWFCHEFQEFHYLGRVCQQSSASLQEKRKSWSWITQTLTPFIVTCVGGSQAPPIH